MPLPQSSGFEGNSGSGSLRIWFVKATLCHCRGAESRRVSLAKVLLLSRRCSSSQASREAAKSRAGPKRPDQGQAVSCGPRGEFWGALLPRMMASLGPASWRDPQGSGSQAGRGRGALGEPQRKSAVYRPDSPSSLAVT